MTALISKARKAFVAGVAAGLAAAVEGFAVGGVDGISWPVVAAAAFAAGLAVYGIRNKPAA